MGLDKKAGDRALERAERLQRIREKLHKLKSDRQLAAEAKRLKDATPSVTGKKLKSNSD
jgi:hypothetical protein